MIPDFELNGDLPEGIHNASLKEFKKKFVFNEKREILFEGLIILIKDLKKANCKIIFVNGSFVTNKDNPNDYDLCWDTNGIDYDKLSEELINYKKNREKMKEKYKGDIFPCDSKIRNSTFFKFFQTNKFTGNKKGIVKILI